MLNWAQLSGTVERLLTILITYAVAKGYVSAADSTALITFGVAGASLVYTVYTNRNTNLAKQAASIPNTTVVTTPEIAAATPTLKNVVSTSDVKVTDK